MSKNNTIEKVSNAIFNEFLENTRYTKSYIKEKLTKIYEDNNYSKTPKANDLEDYFDLKICQVRNKDTGKLDNGFEIIKKKEI